MWSSEGSGPKWARLLSVSHRQSCKQGHFSPRSRLTQFCNGLSSAISLSRQRLHLDQINLLVLSCEHRPGTKTMVLELAIYLASAAPVRDLASQLIRIKLPHNIINLDVLLESRTARPCP
jgi:hypothetical protein